MNFLWCRAEPEMGPSCKVGDSVHYEVDKASVLVSASEGVVASVAVYVPNFIAVG